MATPTTGTLLINNSSIHWLSIIEFCSFSSHKEMYYCISPITGQKERYKQMSLVQIFIINFTAKMYILHFAKQILTWSCCMRWPIYYGSRDYLRNRDGEMLTIIVDVFNINFSLLFLKSYFCQPYKQDIKNNFLLLIECQCFLFC